MRSTFVVLLTWFGASLSLAVPVEPLAQFVSKGDDILLKLDYATYRGHYNSTNEVAFGRVLMWSCYMLTSRQVYTFRNIRFASPPLGELRWQKPVPPPKSTEIQDRQEAIACTQPPSDEVRTVGGAIIGGGSEDCLFLDLTIPQKVFQNPEVKVPVLIWVHGGYYSM